MEKKDILFIGIGEAGNKIVNEILEKDKRYVGLFINSNYNDLNGLKNAKNVYTMPNASGTGKNRAKSKLLLKENRHAIIEEILKYKTQEILTFVFSLGGGTGGGSVPSLILGLKKAIKIAKPINIICVVPAYDESKRYKKNAIECWNELSQIDNINSFYILDNNKREKIEDINKEFATQLNLFMDMSTTRGGSNVTVDEEEIGIIGTCKGATIFYNLPTNENDVKVGLATAMKNSIFADLNEDDETCQYLAISTIKNSYNQKEIEKQFNIDEYAVNTYSDKYNLVVASGYKPQKIAIEMLDESIKEEEKNKEKKIDILADLKIDTDTKTKQVISKNIVHNNNIDISDKEIEDKLNDDDLWDKMFD